MRKYEYKVVPVPAACLKTTGLDKGTDPVAFTVETVLNDLGVEGWEFVRSEAVSLRKGGFFGRGEILREVMVFRRQPVMRAEASGETVPAEPALAVQPRRIPREDLIEAAKTGRRRISVRPQPPLIDERTIAAE